MKTQADLANLAAAATCPRARLREGWRRREIARAVRARYVLTRRPVSVAEIVAATGRPLSFTEARLAGVEGVELAPEGVYPAGRSVAACLVAGALKGSERRLTV